MRHNCMQNMEEKWTCDECESQLNRWMLTFFRGAEVTNTVLLSFV